MKFGFVALISAVTANIETGLSMLSVIDTIRMHDFEKVQLDLTSCIQNGDCTNEISANPRLHAISLVRGTHKVNMDHQNDHPPAVNAYENCLRKNLMAFPKCTSLYDAAMDAGL
tara:strand:- start:398 stop:739 length:342 start_codon:yes stop_codon:yes gene_type:complete